MDELDGVQVLTFANAAAFEAWLSGNEDRAAGLWVQVAKKNSGIRSVTDDELVDSGLCFGWISGQRRSLDEEYYLQKYVPRRPNSVWSQVNVEKVARLTAEGRMRPAGLAEVRRAKADGRWAAAYQPQKDAAMPNDLAAALAADPEAAAAFEALDKTTRYQQLILPLLQARSEMTRQARLGRALERLRAG
jgi:uncharacterized protein YdeI (YjbR/CyaY-like superfamily)